MEYNLIRNAPIFQLASIPNRNELCCLETIINPEQRRDASAKSAFHWQMLKCRIIIFTLPEVIACPNIDFINQVTVVIRKNDGHIERLKKLLEQQRMTVLDGPSEATDYNYRACLRYTIGARTAPLWNPLGEYLVRGRDFLTKDGPIEVVDIELKLADGHLILSICAGAVRMPRLTLSHLGLTERCATDLWGSGEVINDASLGAQWVFVLPSLKKGRVIAVWRKIPPSCPYKTYKELRRHWKNAYGYRIPESSEGMLFYEIYFRPLGPIYYTYPDICVRPFSPTPLRCDGQATIKTFVQDVASKMPTVCDKPFVFYNQGGEASCDLITGTQAENTQHSNMNAIRTAMSQGTLGFPNLNAQINQASPSSSQWSQQISASGLVSLCTPTQGARAFVNPWTVPNTAGFSTYNTDQVRNFAAELKMLGDIRKMFPKETDENKDIGFKELSQELAKTHYSNGAVAPGSHQMEQSEAIRSRRDSFAKAQINRTFERSESRFHATAQRDVPEFRRRERTPPPFVPFAAPLQPVPRAEQRYAPVFNKKIVKSVTSTTTTTSVTQKKDENCSGIQNCGAVNKMTIRVVEKSVEVRPLFNVGGVKRKVELPKIEKPTAKQINKSAAPKKAVQELNTEVLRAGGRPIVEKATVPALLAWLRAQGVTIKSKSVKADLVDKVMSTLEKLNN